MERGDNVVLGNMCENLPHEMVPITKFSAFSSWTTWQSEDGMKGE